MGLLFNTEQTTKMLALINRHFDADKHGGGMSMWRDRADDVDPSAGNRKKLHEIARAHDVYPDAREDALGKTKARWVKWLKLLEAQAQVATASVPGDPAAGDFPNGQMPANWKAAPANGSNFRVGEELCRQIWNGLNDPNCIEIGFVVVPWTSMSIRSVAILPSPIDGNAMANSTIVTIRTTRVPG
jgi:hypothetical protein